MMTDQETRILKSVALKAAVEVRKNADVIIPSPEIIKLAKQFEAYLRGEDGK
jgi:hypothetical protein